MKQNNRLQGKINQNPDYVFLGVILAVSLVYRIYYFGILHPGLVLYNSDSVSYFTDVNILKGVVDLYRTPIYSYVIKYFEYVSKEKLVFNIILFQHFVSFLSIIPFYFVSKSIIRNKYVVIAATLFYGVWHAIIIQNAHLNPESLCFAGSVLMLFIVVKYIEKPGRLTAVFLGVFPLLLIMLKPTYLMLIFVVLLFLICRFVFLRDERKVIYWGLLGLILSSAGVLGYCEMNQRHNGQFVLSNIALNNTLAHISYSGAYREGGDDEFIAIIDANRHLGYYTAPFIINNDVVKTYKTYYKRFPQNLPPTDDMVYCLNLPDGEKYSPERKRSFVKKSQFSMVYFKYMLNRLFDIVVGAYGNYFVLFVLQTAVIVFIFFRYHKIAWTQGFCMVFVLGQFFSIWIAGLDDMDRHLIPTYPFIIQIAGSFLTIPISVIKKEKIFESIS